jgi:large subunit ribosomal protein L35
MPKMKSISGAKKRFRVTGSGKIKRARAFKRHLLESKSSKRGRKARQNTLVSKADDLMIKRMLLLA